MPLVQVGAVVGNTVHDLLSFEYEGDATVFSTPAAANSFVHDMLGLPTTPSNQRIRALSIRQRAFLPEYSSLRSAGIKGEDVIILTDQSDVELVLAIAKLKGWDARVTSLANLNWAEALLEGIGSIPVLGAALKALFRRKVSDRTDR